MASAVHKANVVNVAAQVPEVNVVVQAPEVHKANAVSADAKVPEAKKANVVQMADMPIFANWLNS